jgi:hypothetical protein
MLLQGEQEARRREVQELHVLLQRAQAQIPMPTVQAGQPEATDEPAAPSERSHRRWWWPFTNVT